MKKILAFVFLCSLILILIHCNKKVKTIEVIKEVPVETIVVDTLEIEKVIEKSIPCESENIIYFDFNSDNIKKDQEAVLNNVAYKARMSPTKTLKLTGHSCTIGSDIYNYRLGLGRGESVYQWLYKVIENPMIIESKGEHEPISVRDLSKNRRVEIKGI